MGIAAAGAGVIAAVPAATPEPVTIAAPQPASPDVSLGAAILPLPPPECGVDGALPRVGNTVVVGASSRRSDRGTAFATPAAFARS